MALDATALLRIGNPGRNLWNVGANENTLEEWKAFPQEKE
jgi:hypothetical protein